MWQRIQTLYLTLAVVLLALMFAFPVSLFSGDSFSGYLFVYGLEPGNGTIPFTLSAGWVPALAVVLTIVFIVWAAASYKNRMAQLRILMAAVLLNIILIGLLFFFNDRIEKIEEVFGRATYKAGYFLPLFSLLLMLMSNRVIRKDEAKVRAANRLR